MKDTTALICTSALVRMLGGVIIALHHERGEDIDAAVELTDGTLDKLQKFYDKEE